MQSMPSNPELFVTMVQKLIIQALVCWLCFAGISAEFPSTIGHINESPSEIAPLNYRLPNNTKPEAYSVFLVTDVADKVFEFSGKVSILINVLEDTNTITLHHRQLRNICAKLHDAEGRAAKVSIKSYDPDTEQLTFETKQLAAGSKVTLKIKYEGTLRTDRGGFYRSSYRNSKNQAVWLATTQFEPTNARHAFPCYDEPGLKATFAISIKHSSKYIALSNMPVAEKKKTEQHTVTRFQTTPVMSTYVVAFIVSDFSFQQKIGKDGFIHRVYAESARMDEAKFPAEESEKILNAISDYLGVNFTLPKMDQAAIPDFAAGAMENWGLVTYQYMYLLYNPAIHSDERKRLVVNTIAHEYGHQWFGNLATQKWWSVLWLSEGFATLFASLGTHFVHPDWNMDENFVRGTVRSVFQVDANNKVRPMTHYVEKPQSIQGLFDNIAYAKSGSVLRMFLHAFTEKSFRKGLNYYLNKKAHQAAVDVDLFESLERAVKEDKTLDENLNVKDIFGSWSNQRGFPVLIVTRDYKNNTITLSQERYLKKHSDPESNLTSWWIPYNFDSANDVSASTAPDGWFPKESPSKRIDANERKQWSSKDWVVFNKRQTGYYRVLYDKRNYELIKNELQSGDPNKFHPITRSQLIDDTANFIHSGRLPHKVFLDIISYLKKETEYGPWMAAYDSLTRIKRSLEEGSKAYKQFQKFVINLVKPVYQGASLRTVASESVQQGALRLACEFGVSSCLTEAKALLEHEDFSSPNNRGLIYEFGLRGANSTFIESLWDRLTSFANDEERREILTSLGSIGDQSLLQKFLSQSVDGNVSLSNIERTILFTSIVTRSHFGFAQGVEFLEKNIEDASKYLELPRLLKNIAEGINTVDMKEQLTSIVKSLESEKKLTNEDIAFFEDIIVPSLDVQISSRKRFEEISPLLYNEMKIE